jgi:hypothetical protein
VGQIISIELGRSHPLRVDLYPQHRQGRVNAPQPLGALQGRERLGAVAQVDEECALVKAVGPPQQAGVVQRQKIIDSPQPVAGRLAARRLAQGTLERVQRMAPDGHATQ